MSVLKQYNYSIDNDTLKELRDFLYSIAKIQLMNENTETDIKNFPTTHITYNSLAS